jgi:hypothetical protein
MSCHATGWYLIVILLQWSVLLARTLIIQTTHKFGAGDQLNFGSKNWGSHHYIKNKHVRQNWQLQMLRDKHGFLVCKIFTAHKSKSIMNYVYFGLSRPPPVHLHCKVKVAL